MKQRYGTELRNKTIASLKSEISLAMDSLLDELKVSESTSVLRIQPQRSNNNFQRSGNNFRQNGRNFGGRGGGSRSLSSPSSTGQSRFCCLCRSANRPDFDTHFLYQCRYLPERDRRRMSSSVRNIEIVDIQAGDDYEEEEEDFDGYNDDVDEDFYNDDEDFNNDNDNSEHNAVAVVTEAGAELHPVSRRVMVRKSPSLSCFYKHHPVCVCLDCGAESNFISIRCAKNLNLVVMKGTQGALQADAKTPLTVVGEVRDLVLTRGALTLVFEGLVVKEDFGEILGGEPFLEVNDIAIRSAKKEIRIKDSDVVSYANQQ